jgi:hypothetical protein
MWHIRTSERWIGVAALVSCAASTAASILAGYSHQECDIFTGVLRSMYSQVYFVRHTCGSIDVFAGVFHSMYSRVAFVRCIHGCAAVDVFVTVPRSTYLRVCFVVFGGVLCSTCLHSVAGVLHLMYSRVCFVRRICSCASLDVFVAVLCATYSCLRFMGHICKCASKSNDPMNKANLMLITARFFISYSHIQTVIP